MPPAAEVTTSREFIPKARFYIHRSARYIALAITLWVSGTVLFHLFLVSCRESQNVTSGFPAVYTAARLWLSGTRGANLQDRDWFRQQSAALGFTSPDVFWGNPPSLSLLLVPLAWLSPSHARAAWTVVSLLMWFVGVEWLRRTVSPGRERLTVWITGLSLASFAALYDPFIANLHLAQIYSFLFFLECATCVLWLRGRSLGAGVFVGTALALKGYGLPLIALAVFRRDRRLLIGAGASFALLAGLASLRLGANSWPDFLRVHLGDRTFSGTAVPALQTFRSFVGVAMLPGYHPGGAPPVLDVAVPGRNGLAYVSCFEDGAISVVDLNQIRELTRLPAGNHVFGIAADPSAKRIYVCSAGTDEIVVLREAANPAILRRIRVQGSPTLLSIAR